MKKTNFSTGFQDRLRNVLRALAADLKQYMVQQPCFTFFVVRCRHR